MFLHTYIGDGKSHYIKNELQKAQAYLQIAINEAFTPLKAIEKLISGLPMDELNCAVYFNFTMLPPKKVVQSSKFKVNCLCCLTCVNSVIYISSHQYYVCNVYVLIGEPGEAALQSADRSCQMVLL